INGLRRAPGRREGRSPSSPRRRRGHGAGAAAGLAQKVTERTEVDPGRRLPPSPPLTPVRWIDRFPGGALATPGDAAQPEASPYPLTSDSVTAATHGVSSNLSYPVEGGAPAPPRMRTGERMPFDVRGRAGARPSIPLQARVADTGFENTP